MGFRNTGFDPTQDQEVDEVALHGPSPGKVSLTSRIDGGAAAGPADPMPQHLIADPGIARGGAGLQQGGGGDPFGIHLMSRSFGEDFSDVQVRAGGASGGSALATYEGGRDVIQFDSAAPSREQVAHELTHVVQRRRFGEGSGGFSRMADDSEVEARDLGARAAAGHAVDVRTAPSAAMQRDGDVAQNIHDKLHGWVDDETGALADLRGDRDRRTTVTTYRTRFSIELWTDFIDNASGDTLRQALALLWPFMTLLQRLETMTGFDDDEDGILQTIQNASDAEVRAARDGIQTYLDELDVPDQYTARRRVWPEQPVENVVWLLQNGDGWVWDDEGPVATAVMGLTPTQRVQLWTDHQALVRAMFSWDDSEQIRRMCVTDDGEMATDTDAARVRMQLATDGAGTDEEGVVAAVASAGNSRDELARINATLGGDPPRGADGEVLTAAQIAALQRRRTEFGDPSTLLTPQTGSDGELTEDSFLGRVEGDMDAGTVDAAMATAHAGAFDRAKQALLLTQDWTSNVDEEAVLRILREIPGELTLEPGETADALSPEVIRQRREASAARIRTQLRADPQLAHIFGALSDSEGAFATQMETGDTYGVAVYELTEAYEGIDTDEAAILRVLRDMPRADRERMRDAVPPEAIITRIRNWGLGEEFYSAFEEVLRTGVIPADHALNAAFGDWGDGTDEDMAMDVFRGMVAADRAKYRRGYLLSRTRDTRADRVCAPGISLSPDDQAALDAYNALYARMDDEFETEELDQAMVTLLGLPSMAEIQTGQGRVDAATIMLHRQRDRLEMGAGLTDGFTTTDDTAEAAHVEFESRYNQAMEDGDISEEAFLVLIGLDEQFNNRFQTYSDTANMVSQIAGTVAAVVVGVIVIIVSGTTATPGVLAWLAANAPLMAGAGTASAIAQVAVSEATGGDFNEATGADGAQQALSGFLNGAMMVAGAGLAEQAATLVGLTGASLTAAIARQAAGVVQVAVRGRAFARGVLTGLIDGTLGGAVNELAMTLTDLETYRRGVWHVLGQAGAALMRGGFMGGVTGAATGGLVEVAQAMLAQRRIAQVVVRIDHELGLGAHVDFDINPTGGLDNLTLRFGPQATEGDIVAHVARLETLQRASRMLGEARRLATTAGHAEQEVLKIEQMVMDRMRQLRGGLSPETRAMIESELDVFRANLDEFRRVAASGDASLGSGTISRPDAPPGYPSPPAGHYYRQRAGGWDLQLYPDLDPGTPRFTLEPDGNGGWRTISREGASGAPAARFPDGTTPDQAFDQLTGPDSRSSFKQYWEMLRDNNLATREQVIAAMLSPGGRSEDSVRHGLKEAFRDRVLERSLFTAPGVLREEAESMRTLRTLTENLNSSDRGNLTEAWYARRNPGMVGHPSMTAEANPGVVGREGRGVRAPDFVEGQTLVELKSTRQGIGPEEVTQVNDDLLVAGNNGTVTLPDGTTRTISSVRLVFSNIDGARGAADQLAIWIRTKSFFSVEVWGTNGVRTTISQANLPGLLQQHGVDSLAALLARL